MTQSERLNKIHDIIRNNKTISKHLAPSYQTKCGFSKIIIWDTDHPQVNAFVDTHKNIFSKTLEKLKKEHKAIIFDAYFVKSDGSCSSYIVIK